MYQFLSILRILIIIISCQPPFYLYLIQHYNFYGSPTLLYVAFVYCIVRNSVLQSKPQKRSRRKGETLQKYTFCVCSKHTINYYASIFYVGIFIHLGACNRSDNLSSWRQTFKYIQGTAKQLISKTAQITEVLNIFCGDKNFSARLIYVCTCLCMCVCVCVLARARVQMQKPVIPHVLITQ